jgi:serine protease AprX
LIAHGGSVAGLGVNNVILTDNIVLYPNPAKEVLNIAVPNHGEISAITITDILGKQVMSDTQMLNNAIDISRLSEGIYFAEFKYNGISLVKKFVKE